MTIKPILFNTEMVRAILGGRKTCTRRIIKPQWEECPNCKYVHSEYIYDKLSDSIYCARCGYPLTPKRKAPYHPGDILYVRETWCMYGKIDDFDHVIEGTDKYYYLTDGANPTPYNCFLVHRNGYDEYKDTPVWHPSIHMPKEAARIWLKVTSVRIERLQEMYWREALDEGVNMQFQRDKETGEYIFNENPIDEFIDLWNSTIKKSDLDRYGWDASPWVWVIEFERCEKPQEV